MCTRRAFWKVQTLKPIVHLGLCFFLCVWGRGGRGWGDAKNHGECFTFFGAPGQSPSDNRISWRDAVVPPGRTSSELVVGGAAAASATEPTGNKGPDHRHVTTCPAVIMEDEAVTNRRPAVGPVRCISIDGQRAVADSSRTRCGSLVTWHQACFFYMALRWFLVQYMALDWFLVHGTTLVSCTWHHAAFLYNVHSTTLVSCTVHGTTWFIVHGTTLVSCTMALRWFLVQCTWHCAGFLYHGITLVSRTWHYTPVSSSRHYACSYSASSRTWHYAGFLYLALRMFLTMWCPWLIKLQLNYCFKDFKSSEPICLGFTIQDAVSKYFHHPFLKSFHPIFNK